MGYFSCFHNTIKKREKESGSTDKSVDFKFDTTRGVPTPPPCLHSYPWLVERQNPRTRLRNKAQKECLNNVKRTHIVAEQTEEIGDTGRESHIAIKREDGKQVCELRKHRQNRTRRKIWHDKERRAKRNRKTRGQGNGEMTIDARVMFLFVWFTLGS